MNTVRLNITLPSDVAEMLSGVKNKSAYIADALLKVRKMEEKERWRRELEEAYRQSAQEDFECYKEWEPTLADGLDE